MAGTKNIFNADPVEVVIEALRMSHGTVLDLTYATVAVVPTASAELTRVTVTPKEVNGYSLYVEPLIFDMNKLNLAARLPKDMCYSGNWPATFTAFSSFMNAAYGLVVRADEWEIVHNGTTYPLTASTVLNFNITSVRNFVLRPSVRHLLFSQQMQFPMLITTTQAIQ